MTKIKTTYIKPARKNVIECMAISEAGKAGYGINTVGDTVYTKAYIKGFEDSDLANGKEIEALKEQVKELLDALKNSSYQHQTYAELDQWDDEDSTAYGQARMLIAKHSK